MVPFSNKNRSEYIHHLKDREFDVVVVGGGITGAGVFLDAQSRGLNCCLIEMQDFAEGTSSRSTKLIHGGLRYLKQLQFKVVNQTGRERNTIYHIARHLTYPKQVIVPIFKGGSLGLLSLRLAIWIYERLANVPSFLRHSVLSRQNCLDEMNGIGYSSQLKGAVQYVEFQTNDARLTMENIKTATTYGGVAVNRVKGVELILNEKGKVVGIKAMDLWNNESFEIKGKCVINATGAWIDQLIQGRRKRALKKIRPSKGIHLVVEKERFPIEKAIYFETDDKRMVFAIPEATTTYIGTTDTFFEGDISKLTIDASDVKYLLEACNTAFPKIQLTNKDVESAWVGVRPLIFQGGRKPSEISRRHEIFVSKSGLLSIAGGKLTGYRGMAEKVVDKAVSKFFPSSGLKPCNTEQIKLSGAHYTSDRQFEEIKEKFILLAEEEGWTTKEAMWVYKHFGSNSMRILEYEIDNFITLPDYLYQTLCYTLEFEMVSEASDFFIRRTNLFNFHLSIVEKYYVEVSHIIAVYLSQTEEQHYQSKFKLEQALFEIRKLRK